MKKLKKISVSFFIFILTLSTAFADTLNLPTESLTGKFYAVSDGLIVLDQKGVKKNYIRIENITDSYPDYISYTTSPILGTVENTPCRVVFLDTWVVKFKLPNSSIIEIPRYRVKDLEININK